MSRIKIGADSIGILTSVLCAFHCLVVPLLFSSLPFLGLELMENKSVETGLMLIALFAGGSAFRHNYLYHRRKLPLLLFVSGFCFLLLNQLTKEHNQFILIPASAVLIIAAHCLNMRFTNRQKKQHTNNMYAA